ncbi:MAG: putative bifunctional diguanylate cyclase/phosphodiesterase [Bacillota bacterium]
MRRMEHRRKGVYRTLEGRLMREITADYVIRWDIMNNRAETSARMEKEFGLPAGQFDGALEQWCACVHVSDRRRFKRKLIEYIEGQQEQYIDEFRMVDARGKVHYLLARGRLECDGNNRPAWFVAIAEDVTGLRQTQMSVHPVKNLDDLTKLPNRRCFEDELAFELLGDRSCGVLLVGLDGFKNINNVYGYDVGDALLKSVAGRLSAVLGEKGQAYRYAGDIFAVIYLADQNDGEKIKGVVTEAFKRAWQVKGYEVYAAASVGMACAPRDGRNAQEILHAAELELFNAKQFGKNCHVMYHSIQNSLGKRRMTIENGMRRAIENGFEGFELYYQPVINLERGRVTGAEALLRFVMEGVGEVEPGEFIPLAEYLGLIVPLGRWVIEKACSQCKQWHRNGHTNMYVSVNISIMQMLGDDLVELVRRTLQKTGLSPNHLVLEITENMFIQDMDTVVPALTRLREMGIRISLDDFGKGYSSLTHLKDIPLDEVKIDRDFIQGLGKQAYYETFIHTIVTLAHTINLSVTSEGIETLAQRKKLRELGSDNGQGYFVSPALQPEHLMAML